MLQQLKKNKIVVIVAAVLVAFSISLYYLFTDNAAKIEERQQVSDDRLVEFNGSDIEEMKDGKLAWRLTAEKIKIDPDTNIMYLTHPQALIADVDGKELTINADSGIVDRAHQKIEIKPPIDATTPEGDRMVTDGSVYYKMDTRRISGGKVEIHKSDGTELSGDAFETNAALDDVLLQGHAKVSKGE